MKISYVMITYFLGIFIFYFINKKERVHQGGAMFLSTFWLPVIIYSIIIYVYNLPENIIKNVEERKEKFNK